MDGRVYQWGMAGMGWEWEWEVEGEIWVSGWGSTWFPGVSEGGARGFRQRPGRRTGPRRRGRPESCPWFPGGVGVGVGEGRGFPGGVSTGFPGVSGGFRGFRGFPPCASDQEYARGLGAVESQNLVRGFLAVLLSLL